MLLEMGSTDAIRYRMKHGMSLARLCLVIETGRHSHWVLSYFTGALAYIVTLF